MVPRCYEFASSRSGDAGGRRHHEEGRSLSEDHPTLLCGHADRLHPPLYPALLHGLPHTESVGGQPLPKWTARVSERRSGGFITMMFSCEQQCFFKGAVLVLGILYCLRHTHTAEIKSQNVLTALLMF